MTTGSSMKVESIAELGLSAIILTCIKQKSALKTNFGLLRVAVLHRFYCNELTTVVCGISVSLKTSS